jgi:hypothetical protein
VQEQGADAVVEVGQVVLLQGLEEIRQEDKR